MGETDHISGNIEFMHFPLDIANPFIPDDMAKMGGDLDGTLAISGQSDKPMAEGYLILDTASVYVGAAGSTFRFDDKKIEIKNNRILFNQYGIYAYNKNPFIINGEVDFNDLSRMTANLKLTANNLQLLNVKKNEESLVYGKLFEPEFYCTRAVGCLDHARGLAVIGRDEYHLRAERLPVDRARPYVGHGNLHLFHGYFTSAHAS